jgi:hypothetical protein
MKAEVTIETPKDRIFKGDIMVASDGKLHKRRLPLMPLEPGGGELKIECRSNRPSQLTIVVRNRNGWVGFDHAKLSVGGPYSSAQGRQSGSGRFTSWASSLRRH